MGIVTIPEDKTIPFITDPSHIFTAVCHHDEIALKASAGTTSTSADAAFYTTYIPKYGATASVSADDTYVTLCDIDGDGFINNIICPTVAGTHTSTIKFTIDGKVYELEFVDITSTCRVIWGFFMSHNPAVAYEASDTGNTNYIGNYTDIGFYSTSLASDSTLGLLHYPFLVPPYHQYMAGHPGLYFENSCKIEVKINTWSSSLEYERCGVIYRLNP
jgi:hypothetical protein